MFFNCSSLEELNLSGLNSKNISHFEKMFYKCTSLKDLNISNFISNVKDIQRIFDGNSKDLIEKFENQIKNKNKKSIFLYIILILIFYYFLKIYI